jgi:hypothetical protein
MDDDSSTTSLVQLGHLPKHDERSSRVWLHGKLLVALLRQKLIDVGRNIPPADTFFQTRRPLSRWREFSFALHQLQLAIEPNLSLKYALLNWNGTARALAENQRTAAVLRI